MVLLKVEQGNLFECADGKNAVPTDVFLTHLRRNRHLNRFIKSGEFEFDACAACRLGSEGKTDEVRARNTQAAR